VRDRCCTDRAGAAVAALVLVALVGGTAPRGSGLIVFASDRTEDSNAQIYAVSAAGGARTNLSRTPNTANADPIPSPDGRLLLFVASPIDAATVSVSRNDGRARRRLGAGDEAVWSPDGRSVAFVTYDGYKLAVVGADGHGARTLRGGLVQSPAWSPDGKQIAFVVRAAGPHGRQYELHVIDADGTNDRTLGGPLALAGTPSWSPDGKLVIGAAPADDVGNPTAPSALHVFDPAERILPVPPPKVPHDTPAFRLMETAWSPDGRTIAITSGDEQGSCGEIDVVGADGSGFRRLTPADECSDGPAWSPDGKRLAFSRGGDIVTVQRDGGRARVVARAGPAESLDAPSWSPNGRTMYFTGEVQDPQSDLYTIRPDGSGLHRLTTDLSFELQPRWSPDGRRIAFVRTPDGEQGFAIGVMNADGRGMRILHRCAFTCRSPAWSPDGRLVLFAEGDVRVRLKVVAAAGGKTRTIGVGDNPAWSRSRGLIAYDLGAIYVAGPSGAHPRVAASPRSEADSYSNPAWSPDGATLAFVRTHTCGPSGCEDYSILLAQPGGRPRALPIADADLSTPAWSPDGTRLAYVAIGGGLAVVPRSGRGARVILGGPGAQSGPDWRP
jgi:Tol biopolymer transport system component